MDILLGIPFPLLVALGVTLVLNPDAFNGEIWFARGCFILAATDLVGVVTYWLSTTDRFSLMARLGIAGLTGLLVIPALIGSLLWINARTKTKPKVERPVFALYDLFREDFQVGTKLIERWSHDFVKGDEKLGHYDLDIGLHLNFDARSIFMSAYVPASMHAFEIVNWLSIGYKAYLADMRKQIHIWPQSAESSQALSDSLAFTRTMYVYHDNLFTDEQMHALTTQYRSQGLEPIFRGAGYLEMRKLKATNDPATAPKPFDTTKVTLGPPEFFKQLAPLDLSIAQPEPSTRKR